MSAARGDVIPLARDRRRLAETAYPVPDPPDSLDAWERSTHRDLGAFSRAELLAELERLRIRLLFDPAPTPWLRERLVRLREGLARAS